MFANIIIMLFSWLKNFDFESLDWTKLPATVGVGTLFYIIYNFLNSQSKNTRENFDLTTNKLKEIIANLELRNNQTESKLLELEKTLELQKQENFNLKLQMVEIQQHHLLKINSLENLVTNLQTRNEELSEIIKNISNKLE